MSNYGKSVSVIKQIEINDSPTSRKMYLSNPDNINSEPRIFQLSELIANGSNIGKTEKEWKSVIGITDFGFYEYYPYGDTSNEIEIGHYIDSSILSIKPEGYIWDEAIREYKIDDKYVHKVQRKSKITIKINSKTFEI